MGRRRRRQSGSEDLRVLWDVRRDAVGLKCGQTRDEADEWLARFPDDARVMAYIGRSGWNTLQLNGGIPDDELLDAIDASYAAVVRKLPKKDRPTGG